MTTLEDVRNVVQNYLEQDKTYLNQDFKQLDDFIQSVVTQIVSEFPEFNSHTVNGFPCSGDRSDWGNIKLFFDGYYVMLLKDIWNNEDKTRTMQATIDVPKILDDVADPKDVSLEELFKRIHTYIVKKEIDGITEVISDITARLAKTERFGIDFSTQLSELKKVQKEVQSAVT